MKAIKFLILFILNLFIDLSVLSRFEIYGYIPSLTLPLLIVLSMYYENENIVYYSIFQGLFQDVTFYGVLGKNVLLFYLIAYYSNKNDYKRNYSFTYGIIALFYAVIFKYIYNIIFEIVTKLENMDISKILNLKIIFVNIFISVIIYSIFYFIGQYMRRTKLRKFI